MSSTADRRQNPSHRFTHLFRPKSLHVIGNSDWWVRHCCMCSTVWVRRRYLKGGLVWSVCWSLLFWVRPRLIKMARGSTSNGLAGGTFSHSTSFLAVETVRPSLGTFWHALRRLRAHFFCKSPMNKRNGAISDSISASITNNFVHLA